MHSSTNPDSNLRSNFIYQIPLQELQLGNESLGNGGFGVVYPGKWRNRHVAVKVFGHLRGKKSFENELKQLSEITHPNIVRLYGSSESEAKKELYLIMELSDCSLSDLLHREDDVQPYDLRHACYWAYQAAMGVNYCHELKPKALIHRDLKPDNLLLFDGGKILKVCDFGTAVSERHTMTNNTGTVCYMAPEVFTSEHYDSRCDVFSWSIMFWEILARKRPYFDRVYTIAQKLQHDVYKNNLRPCELLNCPPLIWRLIEKSWDEDPNKRPFMKRVVQEMLRICRIAGIKKNTQPNGHNDNTHDPTIASTSSPMSSQQLLAHTQPSVVEDPRSRLNRLLATKKRLELVRNRREVLERQPGPSNRPLSEVDEIRELEELINSLSLGLDRRT